ncbi:hypothetical protein P4S95_26730 [Aneurinibacillus aneurinilyticus]|uniref:hypothetical protein n=1 Tax=Aneurinibacillus aneurinilyticus TaxID=1391 RepID=UPI002E1E14FF|nr:hypothetical protein [Aneurinibacillus aneurinilyticus]
MEIRISEAICRMNNRSKVITPSDLDKSLYKIKYRGSLFCPHPGCEARVSFISLNNGTKYFRKWRFDTHTSGCPYENSYEEIVRKRKQLNPDYVYRLSDEHIDAVLRRAHDALQGKHRKKGSSSKKTIIKPSKSAEDLELIGTPGLSFETENLSTEREVSIYLRLAENISKEDLGEVRCVVGKVTFMWLHEDYAYINLQSNGEQIKIHFNEAFKESNSAEFSLFHHVKHYINENEDSICCCIGKVYHTPSGYDIRPDRFGAFSINQKKLYAIVNDYAQLSLNPKN